MNGPFVVAQANTGGTPVQVLRIIKPKPGETDILHASFTGTVKVDFTAIANEKITLFHDSKNQSLHVIFADGSQVIIEPFFNSTGTVLANLIFEMGPNQFYSGQEFAQNFPITEDQSVLPAAGAGGAAAGADFHDASVDPFDPNVKLALLPEEFLGNWKSNPEEAPVFANLNELPQVVGHLRFVVEEEELQVVREQNPEFEILAGNGNEDTNDVEGDNLSAPPGNDEDVHGDFAITQKQFSGDFSPLVLSTEGPVTFFVNGAADGQPVMTEGGVQLTSIGENVVWDVKGPNEIWGIVPGDGENPDRQIFILHIDGNGHFTFTLTDQLDHPTPTDDPDHNLHGSLEETLFLDLSIAVGGHDFSGDPFTFPANTVDVGVIDDTPIVKKYAFECVTVDEDDIKTYLSHGTSPNDGNADGSFTGSPFSGGPGPATVCGDLSGLVRVGADAVSIDECGKPHGTFSFINEDNLQETLQELGFIGLRSKGDLLEYRIEDCGSDAQKLVAFVGEGGEGEGCERIVFELKLFSDGKYEFSLFDQMDHDPPHDFVTDGVSEFPGSDQNFDLQDNVDGDVSKLNFGGLIQFSDYDHDTVGLDGVFEVRIRDDVPEIKCDPICLTVDEDDISTLDDGLLGGSLGTSPKDGFADGSSTGSPFNPFDDGPATVVGKLAGLFGVVESGADEPLTFSFISDDVGEHIVEEGLGLLGLKSQGDHISYDIQGNILYAYVGGGGGSGYQQGLGDRLVFKFTLESDGDFKFELFDQLDHDPPNDDSPFDGFASFSGADQNTDLQDGLFFTDVTSFNFGLLINATDFDGDTVNLHDQLIIKVRDDVPEAKYGEQVCGVVEEEQNPIPGGNEDNTPNPLDQDPPANDTTNVASGFGANSLASLIKVGADEPGKFSFKHDIEGDCVKDKNGNDVKSGGETVTITDVDVHSTYTIITAGTGSKDVFTLKVWENGDWQFTLLNELDHQPYGDNVEGLLTLDFSNLIQFSDFDHDTICLNECSFLVKVIDDVPLVTDCNVVQNGSFELGHPELSGTDWNIYSSIPGWTQGADGVPFEVQTGGAGGLPAEEGNALVELDSDTVPNHGPDFYPGTDTNATIQQTIATVAGETYELTFWYAPRPNDGNADSSDMQVLWDGVVVHTVTSQPDGWQEITLHLTATDASTVLAFQGLGQENELGAFIDNVSLCAIGVVDEDGLVNPTDYSQGNHDSRPGDIVVPNVDGDNDESTTSGNLSILWGADNTDVPDGALQDVTGALTGRDVTFTNNSVEVEGVGTLYSHGDLVSFVLAENGTVLRGVANDGETDRTVFEVKLFDDGSGLYKFQLFDQLDHADGQDENDITLGFQFTATDFDGDTAGGHFKVLVDDDVPVVTGEICPEVTHEGGEEGKVANFVFILDTSASIDAQFDLLQDAANNLLTSLGGSGAQDLRVHIVQFNTEGASVGTYDLIVGGVFDNAALTQAMADVNALTDGGFTNYEAGFQEALLWIEGGSKTIQVTTDKSSFDANTTGDNDTAHIVGDGLNQVALISGWINPGTTNAQMQDVGGDITNGWGVNDSNIDQSLNQLLRVDFGAFDSVGVPNYVSGGFNGVHVKSATFLLDDNSSGNTDFAWTIHFTDATTEGGSQSVGGTSTVNIAGTGANLGKEIAYIDFTVPGAGDSGDVDLVSVVTMPVLPGTIPNADINEVIFLSDGEPNRAFDDTSNVITVSAQNAIDHILGVDDATNEVGNTETDGDGAGQDQAFTIEAFGLNVSHTATIDSSDDSDTDINQVGGLNEGGANDDDSVQLFSDGTQVALVSAWATSGLTTGDMIDANIDGDGVGAGDTQISGTERLRFDFGAGTDFDGAGVNFTTNGFNGPAITSATFALDDDNAGGGTTFAWAVHFVGGATESSSQFVNGSANVVLAGTGGNAGVEIDYIEFNVSGAGALGQIDLTSVELVNPPGLAILDQVEGPGGDAENITAPGDLSTSLASVIASLAGGGGGGGGGFADFDLATIVAAGADEDVTFSIKTDAGPLETQGLKSGGVDLFYDVVGDTLTATKDDGGPTVFTLVVHPDGTGTFTLVGTLDDTDGGDDHQVHVDFSDMILAVDFDNDPAVFPDNSFCFEVETAEQGPSLEFRGLTGIVEEEHINPDLPQAPHAYLSTGNEDATSTPDGDDNPSTPDGDDDTADNFNVTTQQFSGDLSGLVGGGSGNYSFALLTGSTLPTLTSNGDPVVYDVNVGGGVLTGYVDSGSMGGALDGTDRVIFTLVLQNDGNFLFTLFDQLDHHAVNAADDVEGILDLDFAGLVQVTDTVSLQTLALDNFIVKVIDDIPIFNPTVDQTLSFGEALAGIHESFDAKIGADEPGNIKITGITDLPGITETISGDGQTLTATFTGSGDPAYTVSLNPDGTYDFQLLSPLVGATITSTPITIPPGTPVDSITTLAVGGGTITFDGVKFDPFSNPNNGTDEINPNANGFGIDNGNVDTDEGFIATFSGVTVTSFTFDINFSGSITSTDVSWEAYKNGVLVASATDVVATNPPDPNSFTIDPPGAVDFDEVRVQFENVPSNQNLRVENFVTNVVTYPATLSLDVTLTATDADGDKASDTFNIAVQNTPPVANDDTIYVSDDTNVAIPIAALLANDTNLDLDTLSITAVSGLTGISGTIPVFVDTVNGLIKFTTPGLGSDDTSGNTFTYTVSDGFGGTDTGTVNVNVINTGDSSARSFTIPAGTYAASYLDGHGGDDSFTTGAANDILVGGTGRDNLDSGSGNDVIIENVVVGSSSDSSRFAISGSGNDVGQDTLTNFDLSNDILQITATNVASFAHGGASTAIGTAGAGTTGSGADSYTVLTGLVSLNDSDFNDSSDIVVTFASPVGTFDEVNFEARLQYDLTGTGAGNTITTGDLNDVLNGAGGNDTLTGGKGDDTYTGGTGNDNFVLSGLSAVANGHDSILDFVSGTDDIFVDVAAQALTLAGATPVAAADFHTGNENNATDWNGGGSPSGEFLWNNTTKELWYSANGTGSDKIDLAHISTGVPTAADVHTF